MRLTAWDNSTMGILARRVRESISIASATRLGRANDNNAVYTAICYQSREDVAEERP